MDKESNILKSRVVIKEMPNSIDLEVYVDGVLKLRTFNPDPISRRVAEICRDAYIRESVVEEMTARLIPMAEKILSDTMRAERTGDSPKNKKVDALCAALIGAVESFRAYAECPERQHPSFEERLEATRKMRDLIEDSPAKPRVAHVPPPAGADIGVDADGPLMLRVALNSSDKEISVRCHEVNSMVDGWVHAMASVTKIVGSFRISEIKYWRVTPA